MDLRSAFLQFREHLPAAIGLICPNELGQTEEFSRERLGMLVDRYSSGLIARGVRHGDRIVLALETSVAFVTMFWAVVSVGAIAVPTSVASKQLTDAVRRDTLERICAVCRPSLIIVDSARVALLGIAQSMAISPVELMQCGELRLPDTSVSPNDCAILQFTSGSTSDPKGCMLTHGAMVWNARAILTRIGANSHDVSVSWLPLFHDMGLMTGVVAPVVGGVTAHLRPPTWFLANPLSWLRDLGRLGRTHTAVPNSALALILQRLRRHTPPDLDLRSIATFVCGAEHIDPELVRAFLDAVVPFGFPLTAFQSAYGMAEVTLIATSRVDGFRSETVSRAKLIGKGMASVVTRVDSAESALEIVSLGDAVSGSHVRIMYEGRDQTERSVGEIEILSPSLMSGYYANPSASNEAFHDGWLRTGDLGYIADGELFFVGRLRDMIVVAGNNIFPNDLEETAARRTMFDRNRLAAYGTRGRFGTEGIHFIVESRTVAEVDRIKTAISIACIDVCGVLPTSISAVPLGTIPRTTSGKIRRAALRRAHEDGTIRVLT